MPLYDAHNHLQDEWLTPYRAECMAACERLPVAGAVVNGTEQADWKDVAALAGQYPWMRPSYGLHPWFVSLRPPEWAQVLREYLSDPRSAVGEIGLDRWKEPYDLADQLTVFETQWNLAVELERPMTVHCLKAWGALADFLKAAPRAPRGFLLHAYGGPAEMVEGFVKAGAYFSFNGYFLHPRKAETRRPFAQIPLDRLLVETDAPAMALPPEQIAFPLPPREDGTAVNHPANLRVVYEGLAKIRGMGLQELAGAVEQNFLRLFGH
jgi:TatD DNase family protein